MIDLETDVESALKKAVKRDIPGALCLKLTCPGYNGVPDRMILCPTGLIAFVELKRPGKTERTRQTYVQDKMERLGFIVFRSVNTLSRVASVTSRLAALVEKRCAE